MPPGGTLRLRREECAAGGTARREKCFCPGLWARKVLPEALSGQKSPSGSTPEASRVFLGAL